MEKRSSKYYKAHTVILANSILPSKASYAALRNEISNGLFAAITERKNVVLKQEYQDKVYLNGYTCYHPILDSGVVDTSTLVGLRLEDAIKPSGEVVTHIYFRTQSREYLSYNEECLRSRIRLDFERYKKSGKKFAEFEYLFSEIDDNIPEIQIEEEVS